MVQQPSADDVAPTEYPPLLKRIIDEGQYRLEQINKADETSLYFKMLPDRTVYQQHRNTHAPTISHQQVCII
ncbi:hypothetical protein DPMN_024761 [Dreissena polymorpha]|uniref:Uncharacterized protein n=1 Tax=Dreissena polymorpha TaxID=45954 RepID=A0A9D4RCZ1_DREPO|nr:hypothetical protein DPMN_024761 [Dreissena polymorpha]